MDHGCIIFGLLPVSATVFDHNYGCEEHNAAWSEFESEGVVLLAKDLPQTSEKNRGNMKIAILHKAIQKELFSVSAFAEKEFDVSVCSKGWKFRWVLISYYRENSKGKSMLGVKHLATANCCVRCLVSEDDILVLDLVDEDMKRYATNIFWCEKSFKTVYFATAWRYTEQRSCAKTFRLLKLGHSVFSHHRKYAAKIHLDWCYMARRQVFCT